MEQVKELPVEQVKEQQKKDRDTEAEEQVEMDQEEQVEQVKEQPVEKVKDGLNRAGEQKALSVGLNRAGTTLGSAEEEEEEGEEEYDSDEPPPPFSLELLKTFQSFGSSDSAEVSSYCESTSLRHAVFFRNYFH